jgi:hypothetical protein
LRRAGARKAGEVGRDTIAEAWMGQLSRIS